MFTNQTLLYIKDYVLPSGRKYAYHWQHENGDLIVRWDNAVHWYEIETFPFHKHIKSAQNVVASTEVWIDEILEIINFNIKKHK